ncbi:glutamate racemase [Streptomyces sp. 35G-GA-8]|uniref:glutamate racemase n=1 Tax=Streptomyces sp. 35G-GA-8 TaxID=2939434 RepID=UPI00201F465D|nr:aspartate/glutamate racemase family protein [Streptomyces sp. 35G-GA-8]MCL7376893.1 aspartate/glutamate racemase family protein [Streptomyces sp. 35G-GA-8]
MKIALMDSGIGLLAAAGAVRRLCPEADLVLSSDPDGMPWGPRSPRDVTERALVVARAAAQHRPDALIVACNTASVHALPALRAELEPRLPVIGTVPAIKPAAAGGVPFAIWATPATTGSPYQRGLIREFAASAEVTEVPCPGLADAVENADDDAIDRAVAAAAALTPRDVRVVVLGCTHYELVAERIRTALGHRGLAAIVLHGSAGAVAAQALRRIGGVRAVAAGVAEGAEGLGPASAAQGTAGVSVPRNGPLGGRLTGRLTVLLGGRESALPEPALAYAEGRLLAAVSQVH